MVVVERFNLINKLRSERLNPSSKSVISYTNIHLATEQTG